MRWSSRSWWCSCCRRRCDGWCFLADTFERERVRAAGLGDLVDLHRAEIGLLDRAERDPRLATIVKLANGLALSPASLLADIP